MDEKQTNAAVEQKILLMLGEKDVRIAQLLVQVDALTAQVAALTPARSVKEAKS